MGARIPACVRGCMREGMPHALLALSLACSAGAAAQTGAPPGSEPPRDWRETWTSPVQPVTPRTAPSAAGAGSNPNADANIGANIGTNIAVNVLDPSRMTTNKGFAAAIYLAEASEAERFVRAWNQSAATAAPTLTPAERTSRGQSIVLLVLYSGCSEKTEGTAACEASFDVKTLDPNGKAIMSQFDIPLARGIPAAGNAVQLSPMTLQTDFEASDPEGLYRYEITLRNPQRNAVIRLSDSVVLGAAAGR